MYKTILVPLDGSRRAEAILPHVEELARKYGAKAVLLKVDEPQVLLGWDEHIDIEKYKAQRKNQREQTEAYLSSVRQRLEDVGIQTLTIIGHGMAVKEIIRKAEEENCDIIAMASHGQGGGGETFYGSTAIGILNSIDRPLLLIRSR